ncbi:MAG: hypothetical protein V1690_03655 [Candidatus Moraniibacteriota bacterium]
MPPSQGNLEKEELFKPELKTSRTVETLSKGPEILPPPGREGETGHGREELDDKVKAVEKHAEAADRESETYEIPKTIGQLGAELVEVINDVPEGGNIDLDRVENKCKEVVELIISNGDKSPEQVKAELIQFAENNFKGNESSLGFIITELIRVADQKINNIGY